LPAFSPGNIDLNAIRFDYIATRNNAIIIPSCGFDSVPADLVTHAARKTLNDYAPSQLSMTKSMSAYNFKGGISGGTAATALSALTELPEHKRKSLKQDFLLSPSTSYSIAAAFTI
jgi:short subunit dehydrogenase-like uncharacterized protein